ncbi:MAG: UDP-N-acetylmuramate dehydrogenase, partial [Nitrospinaceae bacterium]|nr:UDP-N-acetylmuramate dehydrogenase [Nitrospinaceae bacterium]NIR57527.1 UDP-N-acetylmuramate dehydrogenase [Nitrospinaceae bacterium]NIS88396.1 UDP-N-acetylmuramate dehydrogenase [Nitrospinaceae bacterium]NIT84861.1 UDP-N-acetylmuramate dehydrogenase [Nitrospinaceae bacterium]NIU47427.1 UDP-N-acetylmuramate dehydrogenase [Nitrospinaceae bacterium]
LRGLVVSLKNSFKSLSQPDFRTDDEGKEYAVIRAGSGVKLSFLAKYAARFGLTGIEHLVGIPGSLGGALIMNAGAEGTEIGQVVQRVSRVNADGDLETLDAAELQFHYRKTVFPRGEGILVEAELKLYKGDPQAIHRKMDDHLVRRSAKQPLTIPNSGSIFKNPPGDTAGRLIEAAGLKGHRVGQAAVSRKHANFIVNHGEATAQDVRALIRHIQRTVKEQTGTELETEIIWVGE